jgi:hypothetical protein
MSMRLMLQSQVQDPISNCPFPAELPEVPQSIQVNLSHSSARYIFCTKAEKFRGLRFVDIFWNSFLDFDRLVGCLKQSISLIYSAFQYKFWGTPSVTTYGMAPREWVNSSRGISRCKYKWFPYGCMRWPRRLELGCCPGLGYISLFRLAVWLSFDVTMSSLGPR